MTLRQALSHGAVLILTAAAVGIGEAVVSPVAAQTISSGTNQIFNVGDPPTLANAITITDAAGAINTVTDIRIYIPTGLNLNWDDTVTTLTFSGSAAGKVSTTPIYSANGDTLTITVTTNWAPGDQLIISNLVFTNFSATNAGQKLRLTAGAATGAQDNRTITIQPSLVSISSAVNQTFIVGDAATAISTITVTDAGAKPKIKAASDIRIRIPTGFNMTWNTSLTTATIGGPAAGRVSTTVTYENGGKVLVINVLTNFIANDQITVSGLQFTSFAAASAADSLELVVSGTAGGAAAAMDDKTITINAKIYGVSVSPHSASVSRLPSNGTNYTIAFTVSNTGNGSTSYDLLTSKRPGTVVTTVSIAGTGVTQGGNPDSARMANVRGTPVVATVTYSVGSVAAGSIDTLVFKARAVGSPATVDTGKLAVTVVRPSLSVVKSVAPPGTPSPGANLTYTITLTNGGTENAVSVVHVDSLPAQIGFKVGSVGTTLPPGVSGTVAYSNNGGSTWTYVPVSAGCSAPPGYDYCVRDIRLSLNNPLSNVGPNNTAQLVFVARVR
ncbi:MAG TPA: hypothetical protein VGU74_12095 [Gemmatimonadales bacterium]|nr:hypothetical protein [Gemmatimonadales bacterium]